jgi:hypothetical protein
MCNKKKLYRGHRPACRLPGIDRQAGKTQSCTEKNFLIIRAKSYPAINSGQGSGQVFSDYVLHFYKTGKGS